MAVSRLLDAEIEKEQEKVIAAAETAEGADEREEAP